MTAMRQLLENRQSYRAEMGSSYRVIDSSDVAVG